MLVIKDKNKNDLLELMKNYKKIDYYIMALENFELKPYFLNLQLSAARDKFRLRSQTTRTVKMNFFNNKKFSADLWRCWHCPSMDSQSHIRVCPAYQKFREGRDLDNDLDLVNFFQQIIKLRDSMTTNKEPIFILI